MFLRRLRLKNLRSIAELDMQFLEQIDAALAHATRN
ncbi:hypothetical protein ACVI1N_007160 [Sinorhizobium medicae]